MSRQVRLSEKTVTVYVDDQPVEIASNANLIQACEEAGKFVPHYCWHPSLSVPGNCRLCLLKIDKAPRLVAGCHTLVQPDLKISTIDPEVEDSREGMMEFLLANHPLDCPVCDRGGECSLQRFSMDYGAGETRFYGNEKRRFPKPNFDPLISIERNRCIHCTRCVRFCDEIAGEAVMGMFGRGDQCYIGTFGDGPVSNIYSGNVIDMCPVGCLTNKPYRFRARPWELRQIPSTCTLCSSGCSVTYWMRSGEVYHTTPPTSRSDQFGKYMLDYDTTDFICNQGRFGNDFGRHADRITQVQVYRDDEMENVSLDEALDETIEAMTAAAEKGRAAVLVSPKLTNEELFLAQLVTRAGFNTNNIDWRVNLPSAGAAAAHSEAQAIADGSLDNVHEYDAVVLVSTGAQQKVPIGALDIKEAARRGEIQLVTLGSRIDSFFADQSAVNLLVPPSELEASIAALNDGGKTPSSADAQNFDAAREILSNAGSVLVVYDPGQLSGLLAEDIVGGVRSLKEALGDKLHTLPLIRESNASGAFFAGAQPDRIPAASLSDDSARNRYKDAFKADLEKGDGLTGPEILQKAAAGEIDALFVIGAGDLLANHPQPDLIDQVMENVEFLAVADLLTSPISDDADVIFPVANFYEKTGTLLNVEGRVGRLTRAERPQGDALPEFDLLLALAKKLKVAVPGKNVAQIFKLLQKISQTEDGSKADPFKMETTRAMFPQAQFTMRGQAAPDTDVRVILRRPEKLNGFKPSGEKIEAASDDLTLIWDDVLQGRDHFGDRATQRDILQDDNKVELHPDTAGELGLTNRDEAALSIGDDEIPVTVKVSSTVAPKLVYAARNVLGFGLADVKKLPTVKLAKAKATEEAEAKA